MLVAQMSIVVRLFSYVFRPHAHLSWFVWTISEWWTRAETRLPCTEHFTACCWLATWTAEQEI